MELAVCELHIVKFILLKMLINFLLEQNFLIKILFFYLSEFLPYFFLFRLIVF